jgi:hypothetical protein
MIKIFKSRRMRLAGHEALDSIASVEDEGVELFTDQGFRIRDRVATCNLLIS